MLPPELRAERIAELERRLARPAPVGVRPWVALLAIACAGWLLWGERGELRYFVSSREPLSLGREGEYRFDALTSNRYVQVRGVPTTKGAYFRDAGRTFVVVGLRDTPVLVLRETLPSEVWAEGTVPPQPNQSPFAVRGRLLSSVDAQRWSAAFRELASTEQVQPRDGQLWLLVEGKRPGDDWRIPLWTLGGFAFVAVNAWFAARGLWALWSRAKDRAALPKLKLVEAEPSDEANRQD